MSTKKLTLPSMIRAGALATLAGLATGAAAQPAVAAPASAYPQSIDGMSVPVVSTDISAARKTRQAKRTSPRDAYGSYYGGYVGGAGTVSPSYPGYGYGVGDNSRNQTW